MTETVTTCLLNPRATWQLSWERIGTWGRPWRRCVQHGDVLIILPFSNWSRPRLHLGDVLIILSFFFFFSKYGVEAFLSTLLVGKPRRTASLGSFALAAAQIGQFMKFDEMSETSINHGGLSSAGSAPHPGAVVRVVANHDGVVPGCLGKGTTIADVVLDVVDDGALKDPAER